MALNEAKLKEHFGNLNEFISPNGKKHTYEEAKRFWTEMSNDRDKTTAYIISIICRIITVDSVPSDISLPEIYDALILKCDTKANFDAWVSALMKEREKDKKLKAACQQVDPKETVLLRSRLLMTLYFIVTFYPDYNIGLIGTLISRWKTAREAKLLDFELKTISVFGGIDTLDMPKLLRKGTLDQNKSEASKQQIGTLIKQCVENKRRGMRDQFPDLSPSLCVTGLVSDSLCYIKLLSILEQSPDNYESALNAVLQSLADITKEQWRRVNTLQGPTKHEDKEQLLPYLHLFKEFVIRTPSVSNKLLERAYKIVFDFFLWPLPYSHFARDILNFIDAERICPGFSYRNRLLSEYNIQVKDSTINNYERIYLLIDYAAPQALSFREVFKKTEAKNDEVKIHILKRAFGSILGGNLDMPLLDRVLRSGNTETLDSWLSELILNSHEVLYAGQLDSKDILDKHLITLLSKMMEFFNEKSPSPEDKIDNIKDIIDSPAPLPFIGLNPESLPDTPISVKFLNSLMEPKSPEDILDEILTDGGTNVRNVSRGKLGRNTRPKSVMVETGVSGKDSIDADTVIHRTGSESRLPQPVRQGTLSDRIKNFQNKKKRDGSLSSRPSEDVTPGEDPIAVDEVEDDDVIFVDLFGNIVSAKQSSVPRTKRGILAKELREVRAVLKLVIAGDDKSVAMIIKTYLSVKLKHQMSDIDVVFYYIPLSNANTVSGGEGQLVASGLDMGELQDPLTKYFYENQPSRAGDIWMGRLLGHLDGWYETFVALPVQCALQLCPQVSLNVDDSGDPEKNRLRRRREGRSGALPPSPIKIIRDTVLNFTRCATQPIVIRNYYVEMIDTRGKHIESVMCHRMELISRDPGQKATQVGTIPKPASVRLTLHAIQMDGTPYPQVEVPFQRYFVLKASNIPKPGDLWAANPAQAGFQVHAVVGEKVSGGGITSKSRYGPSDQRSGWYVKQMLIEATEKESFHVSIDKENPHSNINHLVVRPTRGDVGGMDKGPVPLLEDLAVPFMTYWPVDL